MHEPTKLSLAIGIELKEDVPERAAVPGAIKPALPWHMPT